MARVRPGLVVAATLVAAAVAATAATGARADDRQAEAARRFQAGSEAYGRGDFRAAARSFDEAYRVAPRAAAVYNAGLSWESAGERTRAADDYTRALERSDLGTAERADATGRLRALERTLGRLTLSAPAGTTLTMDAVEVPPGSTVAHVEPGRHELHAAYADGREDTRTLNVRAGEAQAVRLGDAHAEETPAPPTGDGPKPPAGAHDDTATATEPNRIPAYIAFGGAVVSSIVAVACFETGLAARNDFENGGSHDPSLRDKAETLRTATWVSWGLAGTLAATGLVLYLLPPSRSAPSPAPSSAAVIVGGRGIGLRVAF